MGLIKLNVSGLPGGPTIYERAQSFRRVKKNLENVFFYIRPHTAP